MGNKNEKGGELRSDGKGKKSGAGAHDESPQPSTQQQQQSASSSSSAAAPHAAAASSSTAAMAIPTSADESSTLSPGGNGGFDAIVASLDKPLTRLPELTNPAAVASQPFGEAFKKTNPHLSVDDFELLKVVGKGSFGKVMQVRKKDSGKIFAMKVLKKAQLVARKQVAHTKTERKVLEDISHPFICFSDDTRILTNRGFLFLDEIEALSPADTEQLLYACFDKAADAVVYRPGTLRLPQLGEKKMYDITVPAYRQSLDGQDKVDDSSFGSDQVSIRVTGDHELYVQLGATDSQDKAPRWAPKAFEKHSVDALLAFHKDGMAPNGSGPVAAPVMVDHIRFQASAPNGRRVEGEAELPYVAALKLATADEQTAFLRLYGFWLGHGTLSYSLGNGAHGQDALRFHAHNAADIAWLRDTLPACGLEEGADWRQLQLPQRDDVAVFVVTKSSWFAYFDAEYWFKYKEGRRRRRQELGVRSMLVEESVAQVVPQQQEEEEASFALGDTEEEADVFDEHDQEVASGRGLFFAAHELAEIARLRRMGVAPSDAKSAKWFCGWVLSLEQTGMRSVLEGVRRAGANQDQGVLHASGESFRDQLVAACLHAGYAAHFQLVHAEGAVRGYRVHYSDSEANDGSAGCVQSLPSMSISEIQEVQGYKSRIWCVTVQHDDHLVFVQRAQRESDPIANAKGKGAVVKASQAVIIGQCHLKYAFQTDTKLYMILEYFNGGELFFHLKSNGRFSEERAKFYAAEILCAIECLHANSIVYRDLKPENVLLDEFGHIRLVDFGLSKEGVTATQLTHTFCGTPEYLAPEIIHGGGYGLPVDFWSLGTLLYEMLTGLPPFYNQNLHVMYEKIIRAKLHYPAYLSANARGLLQALLDRNPKTRLGSVNDAEDVKRHPFFEGIDWNKLVRLEIPAPFKPQVLEGTLDTTNVDEEFKRETPRDTPVTQSSALAQQGRVDFPGFSFAAPDSNLAVQPSLLKDAV